MKRKVYVKQMKMLKEKSKSEETELDKESEPIDDSSPSDEFSGSKLNRNTSKSTVLQTASSPLSILSTTAATASSSSASANNRPLPTVDVLMKSSTLRSFQLRQHQEQGPRDNEMPASKSAANNSTPNSNHNFSHNQMLENNNNNNNDNNDSPRTSSLSSLSPYTDNRESFDSAQNVEQWVKDSSGVEHNIGNPSPKQVHPSYRIDYPCSYNVNLDQTDTNENVTPNGMHSPPPVFHQLQASRLNDKIINADTPHEMAGYSTDPPHNYSNITNHKGHQEHYSNLGNGSDVSSYQSHHHPHDASGYNYNTTLHNVHDDHLHEHRGQVRAWEQENYRYVDFTWRHSEGGDCHESVYSESKSTDDENVNIHDDSSAFEESPDLSNKAPSRPSTRQSSGLGRGRRRRKRVQTPVQRSAANMRERRRMCHLNVAFDYLKEHLPNVKDKKKLSRIQTLKAAIYYIHLLQDSLNVH